MEYILLGNQCFHIHKCGLSYTDAAEYCANTTPHGVTATLAKDLTCTDATNLASMMAAWKESMVASCLRAKIDMYIDEP